nr:MAG TPA: SMOOTHENED PROTEIN.3A [Caudoviricetes sp.]
MKYDIPLLSQSEHCLSLPSSSQRFSAEEELMFSRIWIGHHTNLDPVDYDYPELFLNRFVYLLPHSKENQSVHSLCQIAVSYSDM